MMHKEVKLNSAFPQEIINNNKHSHGAYCVPGTVVITLLLTPVIFRTILWTDTIFTPHFIDEETEAHRG